MDSAPLRDVTEEEIVAYWRDGVVHLPNIIGLGWVERMRVALDRILIEPSQRFDADVNPEGTPGRFAFGSFLWTRDDDFRAWVLESPLAPIAAQLLRSKTIHHVFDFYFAKEPHSPHATVWHQDQGGNPVHGRNVAGSWVPLDEVRYESGAVEYIRGSHNWNRWFAAPLSDEPTAVVENQFDKFFDVGKGGDTDGGDEARLAKYDETFEDQPDFDAMRDELDLITFDSGPGDVVLNHLLTVHGAPGNYTDRRRRALGGRWAGDSTVYAKREGRFNIALPWDPGLRDGDPFPPDNDLFPQVWPRPIRVPEIRAAE